MEDNILDEIEKLTNLLAKVSFTFSFYPFQLLKSEQYSIVVFMYLQERIGISLFHYFVIYYLVRYKTINKDAVYQHYPNLYIYMYWPSV